MALARIVCLVLLLVGHAACIGFDFPVSQVQGETVRDVLKGLTTDLAVDASDPEQLRRLYTRLHRLLYHRQLLPLSTLAGGERGGPLDRVAADAAVDHFAQLQLPSGRCLEWQAFTSRYTERIPGCKDIWSADFGSPPSVDEASKTFTMDIDNPASRKLMQGRFDIIVCTFVFGHLRTPYQAAETMRSWLAPGGKLLFVVNFMSGAPRIRQEHNFDHFRFTVDGARSTLRHAGFRIEEVFTGGNPSTATGFLMGFGQHDFSQEEVAQGATLHHLTETNLPHLPGEGVYLSTVIVAAADESSSKHGAVGDAAKQLHRRSSKHDISG